MRYWLKRSRSRDSGWEYAVEYHGFNHTFPELEFLRDFRYRLSHSRREFVWSTVSSPFRSLLNGTFNSTEYHVVSWPQTLRYFWKEFVVHVRYHDEITSLLDEAYETFRKGQKTGKPWNPESEYDRRGLWKS